MNKLRQAAQAVMSAESLGEMAAALDALSAALDEDKNTEFELWGRVTGHRDSRWPVEQFDGQIWPDGTVLYVKVGEKK